MAIRKKPINSKDEAQINAVIKKGGSPSNRKEKDAYKLALRIPAPLKMQVDVIIEADPTQPSLTAWILEAMKQRVQKESKE
jgi:hypothetical protein